MSLLWPERLLVSLAPAELRWVRLGGRFRPTLHAKGMVPVVPAISGSPGAHPWQGALAALREAAQPWRKDRLSVSIVLSNEFVRYLVAPHNAQIQGDEQDLAFARFHFSKVHGEGSRAWDIRLSPAARGEARLASAVDGALIAALRDCFPAGGRLRLVSVQPLLMSAFNGGAASIPTSGAWLVMAEAERTCIALLRGKVWQAVQNVRGQFADEQAWIELVERESRRLGLPSTPNTLLVHSSLVSQPALRNHGQWKIASLHSRWPQGMDAVRDSGYRAALSAA